MTTNLLLLSIVLLSLLLVPVHANPTHASDLSFTSSYDMSGSLEDFYQCCSSYAPGLCQYCSRPQVIVNVGLMHSSLLSSRTVASIFASTNISSTGYCPPPSEQYRPSFYGPSDASRRLLPRSDRYEHGPKLCSSHFQFLGLVKSGF